MRQIYKLARQVVIWLGPDNVGTATVAFEALEEIARWCKPTPDLSSVANLRRLVPETMSAEMKQYVLDREEELGDLFELPWFSRLWVVQEVNVTTDVQVRWGSCEFSWDLLSLAFMFLGVYYFHHSIADRPGVNGNRVVYLRHRSRHEEESLLAALHAGRDFDCSDPRDRIYALLGMPALHKTIEVTVNYEMSTLQLFQDIARAAIERLKSLDVLSYVQHEEDDLDTFPSWIPRWDDREIVTPLIYGNEGWNADRGKLFEYSLDDRGHALVLTGVCFDTILNCESFSQEQFLRLRVEQAHLDSEELLNHLRGHPLYQLQQRTSRMGSSNLPIDATLLNLGKVLCGGAVDGSLVEDVPEKFLAYFKDYMERFTENAHHRRPNPTMHMRYDNDTHEYERSVLNTMRNRSLFTTVTGYRGCGTDILQPGDKLCVLFGGHVPYVLRPAENHYKFIGEAYVEEFMYGRAIDMLDAGELQQETFELR